MTFSNTYQDTTNLSCLSRNCIEFNDSYYCSSSGRALSIQQGSYCQIIKTDYSGIETDHFFSFSSTRGYSPGAPLIQAENNDFIISVGETVLNNSSPSSIVVNRLSPDFDTIWHYRHSDTTQFDTPSAMIKSATKIYVAGIRNYINVPDPYTLDGILLILNNDGSFFDFKTYHSDSGDIYFHSIIDCADGNFFLAGETNVDGGNEGYIVKIDSLGNMLWDRFYPEYSLMAISKFSGTKVILSGYKLVGSNLTAKYSLADTSGSILWTQPFNAVYEFAHYISKRTRSGDIVSVGITSATPTENNSGYVSRTDSTGELKWQRKYNYNQYTDFFTNVIETSDGGLLINGSADSGSDQNLWLVKLDSMGCLEPDCWVGLNEVKPNDLRISVYPNPAKDWINFKLENANKPVNLELYSISGQRVMNTKLFAPLEAVQVSHLSAGLYLAKFTLEDGRSVTERVVISR